MTRSIERCYGGCAGNLTASIDCPAQPTKVKDGGDRTERAEPAPETCRRRPAEGCHSLSALVHTAAVLVSPTRLTSRLWQPRHSHATMATGPSTGGKGPCKGSRNRRS